MPAGQPVICKVCFNQSGNLYVLIVLLSLVLLRVAIPSPAQAARLHHYEYVFPDNSVYVYDMDNRGALVKHRERCRGLCRYWNAVHQLW
jgi:hypothetical protein